MEKLLATKHSKIIGLFGLFVFTILTLHIFLGHSNCDPIIDRLSPYRDAVDMPLVYDTNPHTAAQKYYAPIEQRGPEVRKWLSPGVKISVSGASGSGTIVYYDDLTGWAYVSSCGHLWSGTKSAEELKSRPSSAKVITWYHNDRKLDSPASYQAEVLYWSNSRGYDTSLLRFRPDWRPDYFPIAPKNYAFKKGMLLHSVGCDGAREIAHYDVEYVEHRGEDVITQRNSPRPGRSGGGLMSSDGWYVGTCWGTSSLDGSGIGYFTSLASIHQVCERNGYGWLLEVGQGTMAQRLPIMNWSQSQRQFERDYVPIPGSRMQRLPFSARLSR